MTALATRGVVHDERWELSKLDLSQRLSRLLPFASATARPVAVLCDEHEAELVARIVRAEQSAIDLVYRAHHKVLRAFAQRVIGEPAAAEDLVHDLFVQLPTLVRGFRGQSTLRSFLLGVAANLSHRYIRAASRRRAALARLAQGELTQSGTPSIDQAQRERARTLYSALDTLTTEQRSAFVLCEVEERSADEVAEILGIPAATVRTRCFHARKKLVEKLKEVQR